MNAEQRIALENVIAYLTEDEVENFDAFVAEGNNPEHHIFYSVRILQSMLEQSK